ncbi:hypothetical protein BCS95_05470 [Vibrio breoganii]|uniref:DUF5906 domain-containing protein n=1 Tax=Vibrio breoganii TaxID=553239 RepID=UPI000C8544AD|nr:DUF5906 domain-containing protein [Vibrio breoganii]PMP04567.1 hypothetical protein BCS95_05470 [Vibrio breoganii]
MFTNARKKDESYRYEKAVADAICHEMPISFGDSESIILSRISDEKNKRIIATFQELYQTPTSQPTNKQIADEIHGSLVNSGYSAPDADKEANAIEDLLGRKRQPNISLVADGIKYLTVDVVKPTYLHLVSNEESPVAYDSLLNLCRTSTDDHLDDNRDTIVRLLNSTHSVVKHGSKTLICEQVKDHKGNVGFEFSSEPQKRAFYANLNISHMVEDKIKKANCFDLWMKDHDRNTYQGVVFDPSNRAGAHYLNMWSGFTAEAIEGDDRLDNIMWHLRNVVCNGDDDHFYYLLAWMAHTIQKPHEKTGVCVVLKSEARGTGKSTVSKLMEKMLGFNSMRVQDTKHLLGSFNSHLANKLFITVEESFWSGSNKDAGKFRTLITESTITIEAKGKDAVEVDSFHRFLLCTNNDWAVPQTRDERRFFVLEVSEEYAQNKEYFTKLHKDIDSPEAIGQLFNFLSNYDLTPYDLHKAPRTEAVQQQVMESLPNHANWFIGVLEEGSLGDGGITYQLDKANKIPKRTFFNSYIDYCDKMSAVGYDRLSETGLGTYLMKKLGVVSNGGRISISKDDRPMGYMTKPLEEMEQIFKDYYEYR